MTTGCDRKVLADAMRERMVGFLANEASAPSGPYTYHVIVEVQSKAQKPSEAHVRDLLTPYVGEDEEYRLDLFFVIRDIRFEDERGFREFNPYCEGQFGEKSYRFLSNCAADFAILPSGTSWPSWCHERTRIVYVP